MKWNLILKKISYIESTIVRHRKKTKKFNRTAAERKSLYRNLVQSLFLHERITTTEKKAKAIRPIAEKLITRGKRQDLSARRALSAFFPVDDVARKVYDDLAIRFKDRPGGYLRILKLGFRQSDGTDMAIIELVEKKKETKKALVKDKKSEKEELSTQTDKKSRKPFNKFRPGKKDKETHQKEKEVTKASYSSGQAEKIRKQGSK